MGLDQFLQVRVVLDHKQIEQAKAVIPTINGRPHVLLVDVGQWRKAYAIHQWFVDNANYDNDDDEVSQLSEETLQELLTAATAVLADRSKAAELLPACIGCDQEYDDEYFGDLEYTKTMLEKILSDEHINCGDFFRYQAWY